MLHTEALVEALGGKKVFKRRIVNVDQLRETVKAGLPYASLEALIGKFGLAREEAGGSPAFTATDNRAAQKGAETAG